MGDTEPELRSDSAEKSDKKVSRGAKSGAPGKTTNSTTAATPDLAKLMALWTQLSGTAQSAILALAGAAAIKGD